MRRPRLLGLFPACLVGAILISALLGAQRFVLRPFAPASAYAQAAVSSADAANQALEPLVIVTASGRHAFRVELARTDAEREKGLMFRRSLPSDRGMLFNFKATQSVMMWMKNTYVPLDMIFIARNGRVTHIAENAEPLSETIIPSDGPAFAVLEVNAGTAQRISLKPGDKIENALFAP